MHLETRPSRRFWPIVAAASCVTLGLGLAFIFIRAPHPWGWEGFDHYHELGLLLARGEPFPTIDYPWGYAYFLAAFYRIVGDRPWVPLVAQALLNGLVPALLYLLVRRDLGERTAAMSAALTAVMSFNTVYASTQSSDAVCTVLFLAGLVAFREGLATGRAAMFAAAGLLAGAASQFRPNLLLFPAVAAGAAWVLERRVRARDRACLLAYVVMAGTVSVPWIVRNYRLTGELIPTSTHGGLQLWYGSLQTGPYLKSRVYNPRSTFEAASFDYSSLAGRSLIVTASPSQCAPVHSSVRLIYWTDRDPARRTIEATPPAGNQLSFQIPGQPIPTTVYYHFSQTSGDASEPVSTPARPNAAPFVFFVDNRHLADLDRHGDILSGFTFVRLVRAIAWHEPLPFANRLDLDRDGTVAESDLQLAARALVNASTERGASGPDVITAIQIHADDADVQFADGSTLFIPRTWSERISDVMPRGGLAQQMLVGHTRLASLPDPHVTDDAADPCRQVIDIHVNDAFYRREPHLMRRYTALAVDNIRRGKLAFVEACLYRTLRLFVVDGSSDAWTVQQFEGSRRVYLLATMVSGAYLAAGLVGIVVATKRRLRIWLLLAPIVYVPITICYLLSNMRYTVTIQPPLFAFVAVAVMAVLDRFRQAPSE